MSKTHGMSKTRIYHIWKQMRARCNNPNTTNYKYYGERGISVCPEWNDKHNFDIFYKWAMANGYEDDLTIDRIDYDGDYCPLNCRWVTWEVQHNNQRYHNNAKTILTYHGESRSLSDWSKITGIEYHVLKRRYDHGWSTERIIETPFQQEYSRHKKC